MPITFALGMTAEDRRRLELGEPYYSSDDGNDDEIATQCNANGIPYQKPFTCFAVFNGTPRIDALTYYGPIQARLKPHVLDEISLVSQGDFKWAVAFKLFHTIRVVEGDKAPRLSAIEWALQEFGSAEARMFRPLVLADIESFGEPYQKPESPVDLLLRLSRKWSDGL